MYKGYKVVGVTAYGRRRYAALLSHYLREARNLIDEHHFWVNTQDAGDIEWLRSCVTTLPTFFRTIEIQEPFQAGFLPRINAFYREYAVSPDTIFIRFDDDIVWIAPQAIRRLLDFRVEHPEYFLVFANTVNNSLCTHLHQRQGMLGDCPPVEYHCMGKSSWSDWEVAARANRALLAALRDNQSERFLFERWELFHYERCSINCISWWGRDMASIVAGMHVDEEQALACEIPKSHGRINCIAGQALVSHFAYFLQRPGLEANTKLLERYGKLIPV